MSHILVTGGSRGIGRAICETFADNGYDVSYFYVNRPSLEGEHIYPVRCDVSDHDAVAESVDSVISRFGDIDVLVSNSGISISGLATDYSPRDYRRVMDVNFGGLFNVTNRVIPGMVHRKHGVIIAISSMWGQTGASYESLYAASKGAVDAYVRSLAKELAPSGIRVNAVSPGCIDTDMMADYSDEDRSELIDETPLARLGTPQDVADAVYYLASDRASFITGQIIGVNGGFLI
ncbi:3-oxoacyl-[acyl-carrier protein] reductase [Ruminococcaceae bacterium YRB3002]|nr:3-oxoacyl-[acyl-carrier protein] reductase [Ruminococcaceae bacterium YRB3002]